MKVRYLYSEMAKSVQARLNCETNEKGNTNEWHARHEDALDMMADMLPSGSGFDSGTKIDLERSHGGKLVLTTSYHHINENGYYCGWTEHTVTVTPSFGGFNIRVSGRNRNDIKDYISDTFCHALTRELTETDHKALYGSDMRDPDATGDNALQHVFHSEVSHG
jgi:hypothetical protein